MLPLSIPQVIDKNLIGVVLTTVKRQGKAQKMAKAGWIYNKQLNRCDNEYLHDGKAFFFT